MTRHCGLKPGEFDGYDFCDLAEAYLNAHEIETVDRFYICAAVGMGFGGGVEAYLIFLRTGVVPLEDEGEV